MKYFKSLNINQYYRLITGIVFLLFISHQTIYIFDGGSTWDEYGSIINASKQIYKFYVFLVDFNNPIFQLDISPPEHYGGLLFIPAYLSTFSENFITSFSLILKNVFDFNLINRIEAALIIRHILINLYVVVILLFILNQLSKVYSKKFVLTFLSFLLLIPSVNGHSLFNLTDIPFMFQYFFAVVVFLNFLNNQSFKNNLITGFVFGLCLLVRFNAIVFLIFLFLFEIIINAFYHYKFKVGNYQTPLLKKYILIIFTAFITLFIGTPVAWRSPLRWVQGAIKYQFNQENDIRTIFNGEILFSANTNSDYLFNWLMVKTPIPIIFLFFLSIFVFVRNKKRQNSFFSYSLFFVFLLLLFFIIYKPVTYDGIRHYLFVYPFLVLCSVEGLFAIFENKKKMLNVFIIFVLGFLIFSQSGLGAYKYVYLNEFVDEEKISYNCENNIAQSGCGDWHTDYWGFAGKELIRKINLIENKAIYFCEPHYTYSFFQAEDSPWTLKNGSFVFDDKFPFTQEKYFYYRSDILDYIRSKDFNSISLLTLNYHRPPLDSCGFEELDKNKFDVDCNVIDGVKVELRGVSINLNYLSECEIKKV